MTTVTVGVSAAIPAVALEAGPQIGADPVLAQDHGIARIANRGQNQSLNPALHVVIDEDPEAGIPGPDPDRVVPAGVGVRAAPTGALTITMPRMDTGSMLPIWIAMLVKGTWKNYLVNMDP